MKFWLVHTQGEFNQVLIEARNEQESLDRVEQISNKLKHAKHKEGSTPPPVAINDSPLNWFAPIFTDAFFQTDARSQVDKGNQIGKLWAEDRLAKGILYTKS